MPLAQDCSPIPVLSPIAMYQNIADIDVKTILSEHSENIIPEQWVKIAIYFDSLATSKYAGIIVAHGTDTMQHTASYLAFALQGFPKPIVLTGSQRSSDRPSSDAASNLIASAHFIASNPDPGIFVAMHNDGDGEHIAVHDAVRVRKNHTSKRGAFETMGSKPAYTVIKGKVEKNTQEKFPKKQYLPKIVVNTKAWLVKYQISWTWPSKNNRSCYLLENAGMIHHRRGNRITPARILKISDRSHSLCFTSHVDVSSSLYWYCFQRQHSNYAHVINTL